MTKTILPEVKTDSFPSQCGRIRVSQSVSLEVDGHICSGAWSATHRDLPAMRTDDLTCNRQT